MRKLYLALALLAGSVAEAQQVPYVRGVRFTPQAAAPYVSGQVGTWVKSADGLPYFRKADGTDVGMTGGGGGSGTVTNIASGTGLTGGPITTTGTLSLASVGTAGGPYTNATVTVDAYGRVTAASAGSAGGTGTVTSIIGGTGLSGGTITTTGTLSVNQAFTPTWTGVHTFAASPTFDGDTRSIGDATHRAANLYALNVLAGASQLKVSSAMTPGATPGVVIETSTNFNGNPSVVFRNNGFSMIDFTPSGSITTINLNNGSSGANIASISWSTGVLNISHPTALVFGGTISPAANFSYNFSGAASNKWGQIWVYAYAGVAQTPAIVAGGMTLTCTNGEQIRLVLNATITGAITMATGFVNETCTVEVIQDATGGRGVPTTWTNAKFAGAANTYVNTTTASRRDIIEFRWDAVDLLWIEVSRSMNI